MKPEIIRYGLERAILLLSRDGAWADRGETWSDDDALAIVAAWRELTGKDYFTAGGIPRVFSIPCIARGPFRGRVAAGTKEGGAAC